MQVQVTTCVFRLPLPRRKRHGSDQYRFAGPRRNSSAHSGQILCGARLQSCLHSYPTRSRKRITSVHQTRTKPRDSCRHARASFRYRRCSSDWKRSSPFSSPTVVLPTGRRQSHRPAISQASGLAGWKCTVTVISASDGTRRTLPATESVVPRKLDLEPSCAPRVGRFSGRTVAHKAARSLDTGCISSVPCAHLHI